MRMMSNPSDPNPRSSRDREIRPEQPETDIFSAAPVTGDFDRHGPVDRTPPRYARPNTVYPGAPGPVGREPVSFQGRPVNPWVSVSPKTKKKTTVGRSILNAAVFGAITSVAFSQFAATDTGHQVIDNIMGRQSIQKQITPIPSPVGGDRGIPQGTITAGAGIMVMDPTGDGNATGTSVVGSSCSMSAVISTTQFITAGHCVGEPTDGAPVTEHDVYLADTGEMIGKITASRFGDQSGIRSDAALVTLNDDIDPSRVKISTISTEVPDYGEIVRKNGITTGETEGPVSSGVMSNAAMSGDAAFSAKVDSFAVAMCSLPGDSGAGVLDENGDVIGTVVAYTDTSDPRFKDNGQNQFNPENMTPECTSGTVTFVAPMSVTLEALGLAGDDPTVRI